jgi:hypothetical protein
LTQSIIPSAATQRQVRPRDHRVDFWRGLCLIDMVLVHLVYQNVQFGDLLGRTISSYTRFAAGGFIFVSGLSIGVIFLPRALDSKNRGATYKKLWRRSLYILGIQYLSAMGLVMLDLIEGSRPAPLNAFETLRSIFLLREGGDLLPFYSIMIALSPFLMEILRRRGGWIVTILGSIGLFAYGMNHPMFLSIAQQAHPNFPPILWQALFIMGLVFGSVWPQYNALRRIWKIAAAALAWAVFAALFVSEYSSDFGWSHLNLYLSFAKIPLSDGEALRYLSLTLGLIITTDLLWFRIADTAAAAFVQTLGRKSLPVYVAHIWLVEGMSWLAMTWWWMGRWQISFGVASVLALWLLAYFLDIKSALFARRETGWVPMAQARAEV